MGIFRAIRGLQAGVHDCTHSPHAVMSTQRVVFENMPLLLQCHSIYLQL